MKQTLQLRFSQQLTMTPQLQQAIRLLQLSTLELRLEVQQVLESNLMLETEEELELAQEAESDAPEETEGESEGGEELDLEAEAIPDELPVDSDWDDLYGNTPLGTGSAPSDDQREYEAADASGLGLRDHLLWQMRMSPMGAADQVIAEAIIDAIDDDGYLHTDLAEIGWPRATLQSAWRSSCASSPRPRPGSMPPCCWSNSTSSCSAARTSTGWHARWASITSTSGRWSP